MRMEEERLPRKILSLKYERRGRGRPRERWIQEVQDDVEERGGKWNEVEEKESWLDKEIWNKWVNEKENEKEHEEDET